MSVIYQGWRGWDYEEPAPWVPCPAIPWLEKKKRSIGWSVIIWMLLCILSYVFVALVGKNYYHDLCKRTGITVKNDDYDGIAIFAGVLVIAVLGITCLLCPRFRIPGEGSSRFLGLIGSYFELGVVAILGAFLHVHDQSFCWLFVALGFLDLCVMKVLVPNYDFKGPSILAQVAIATSLFPDVRKWSFSPYVILFSFCIFAVKTVLDTNWRKVLPVSWVALLVEIGCFKPVAGGNVDGQEL